MAFRRDTGSEKDFEKWLKDALNRFGEKVTSLKRQILQIIRQK